MSVFDAASRYSERNTPLIVLAGRGYGAGSARDYAAKGTRLLGVRAVLAESFERIHRSNLIGLGVAPLQYFDGETAHTLGLDGTEQISVTGLAEFSGGGWPHTAQVQARSRDGRIISFTVTVRVDTPLEATYIRHGGILPYVLRSSILQPTSDTSASASLPNFRSSHRPL